MGMTHWAALAEFNQDKKGTLERGKMADFVLLDQDIMKVDESELLNTKVVATFVNGVAVHE